MMHLRTHIGIGDLLILRDFIEWVRPQYEHDICIDLNKTKGIETRGPSYFKFVQELLKSLLPDNSHIRILKRCPMPSNEVGGDYYRAVICERGKEDLGVKFTYVDHVKPNLSLDGHWLPKNDSCNFGGPYSVITTRCRPTVPSHAHLKKEILKLVDKGHKIVLVGEKEKKMDFASMYSLVQEVLKDIGVEPIDLTTSSLTLKGFHEENQIMKDAETHLCYGFGGNMVRGIYCNKNNVLCYLPQTILSHPFVLRAMVLDVNIRTF